MNQLELELEMAIALRKEGKLKESNELLIKLVKKYPENSLINYHCAWSFDVLELEKEAIPYYEKAISQGLGDNDLKGAFLGLGSTYRTIGEYLKSKDVFVRGLKKFPKDNAMKTFYAMTLYNLGEHSLAMEILLTTLVETSSDPDINEYGKAIKFYSGVLDSVLCNNNRGR
ncbi:MAG: tetratricopeptide repeat protein [Filifactoraceae bacterium]